MIILTEVNKCNRNKIINLIIKYTNFISYRYGDYYYEFKKLKYYYIKYIYNNDDISLCIQYFNYSGLWHREDGPAYIIYNKNGGIEYRTHYINGEEYSYEDYILEIKKLV